MNGETVYFRCDADRTTGSGHVHRCLALAHALSMAGIRSHFIMLGTVEEWARKLIPPDFPLLLLESPLSLEDEAEKVSEVLAAAAKCMLIVDSYRIDEAYLRTCKMRGIKLGVIDDLGALGYYDCDLLLNQNVYATQLNYTTNQSTRRLLGTRYALLREEFLHKRKVMRRLYPSKARSLLITMGGSDPKNTTSRLLQAMQQMDESLKNSLKITVLLGAGYKDVDGIAVQLSQVPTASWIQQSAHVADVIAKADLAITAGGTTVYELSSLGCPSLIVSVADNQSGVGKAMHAQLAGIYQGEAADLQTSAFLVTLQRLLTSQRERREIGLRAARLVDAKGAMRVASHIREELSVG